MRSIRCASLLLALLAAGAPAADDRSAFDGAAEIEWQLRQFVQSGSDPRQDRQDVSIAARTDFVYDLDQRRQQWFGALSGRLDSDDGARSQLDVGALGWRYRWPRAELTIGVDKVFWGVTESAHLVDIINQTNRVERPDGEAKLGQPMLHLELNPRWGSWSLFVLPRFRTQRFPGAGGRLRGPFEINAARPSFEARAARAHIDVAVRYSHYIGNVEFALSHFAGTARQPELELVPIDPLTQRFELRPFYFLTDQTALELTVVAGGWLYKLEAVSKRDPRGRYEAAVGGVEYSFFGIFDSSIDLGVIAEYQYDGREALRRLDFNAGDDFAVAGARLGFNDFAGSELLLLHSVGRDRNGRLSSLEGSRRIGNDWRLAIEARWFSAAASDDVLRFFDAEDYWQVTLTRYF